MQNNHIEYKKFFHTRNVLSLDYHINHIEYKKFFHKRNVLGLNYLVTC